MPHQLRHSHPPFATFLSETAGTFLCLAGTRTLLLQPFFQKRLETAGTFLWAGTEPGRTSSTTGRTSPTTGRTSPTTGPAYVSVASGYASAPARVATDMAWWRSMRERWGAWRRSGSVALWYHKGYTAPFRSEELPNLELQRGERIVGQLLQEGLVSVDAIRRPFLAEMRQLRRFHTQSWLETSMTPEALARIYGMQPEEIDVDSVLDANRRMVGGTVAAARAVAKKELSVGINLGGGFHHAEPELGSGFCVYNDIGVAISDLREAGFRGAVAIVDLDFHQGNGNTAAYANVEDVFVYSIHGAIWSHLEASGGFEKNLTGVVNDRRYMALLRSTLSEELAPRTPELIFFIAATDVLDGDRLGSFQLTPEGVFERDRLVADTAEKLGAGLVVTMGGGYSKRSWFVHYQLIRALLTDVWDISFIPRPPSLRARYAMVAASLDPLELQRTTSKDGAPKDEFGLTEEDLFGALSSRVRADKFLDYYGKAGFELTFETYGIMDKIRSHGFSGVRLEGDPTDRTRQVVRIFGQWVEENDSGLDAELRSGEHLLVEFIFRKMELYITQKKHRVLFVEWLLLQNPLRSFSLARPPLPAQEFPGLGIAREMQELLVQACHRVNLQGLMDRPSHFHNAVACEEEWRFLDPKMEGRFRAMTSVSTNLTLYEATWAAEKGHFSLGDGTVIHWMPSDHILALAPDFARLVSSDEYKSQVSQERARLLALGLHIKTGGVS